MTASTAKKVVVLRFDREPLSGLVQTASWLTESGLEVMTVTGAVMRFPYAEVKTVYFVRDFGKGDVRTARRSFLNRPKQDGLWLRVRFQDNDTLEGIMPNNLLQFEAWGLHLIPPDGAQRVFLPRAALSAIEVLAVTGSSLRKRKKPAGRDQIGLFEETA